MAFQTTEATAIFKDASFASDLLVPVMQGRILTAAGTPTQTKNGFTNVQFSPDPGVVIVGWVPSAHIKETGEEPPRPPLKVDGFVRTCVEAELGFNDLPTTAPWFALADFVIARAIFETNFTNAGPKIAGSDGVGPLQVTSAEWDSFLQNAGPFAKDFTKDQRDNATIQVYGATYRMFTDAKAISKLKLDKGVGTEKDPFLPSYLDLFHAYLTGSPAAAIAIHDAEDAGSKDKKINEILTGPLTNDQITALFKARGSLTGTIEAPKTLADFIAGTEKALGDGMKQALDLIKQHDPEDIPAVTQGEAPWFDAAKAEEAKHIAEPDKHILTYFEATDFGPANSTDIPWCGAFAAFCMKESGNGATIPKQAAVAASWKSWGNEISLQTDDIPQGAVIVLSHEPGTGGSGHVGFFVQFSDDGKHVVLLGGNQSNAVNEKPFLKNRIAAARWLERVESRPDGPSSATPISPAAIKLIFDSEVGSEADYNRLYHKPTWPGGGSGVTIGIGYDVGQVSKAQLAQDWNNILSSDTIDKLKVGCGVHGGAARPLARQLADDGIDVPLSKANAEFNQVDIPRWIGIVERALPNASMLNGDCLGALVSLAYNRGASFSAKGSRYQEMNNIKTLMTEKKFTEIPAQFRAMKRLWPTMRGLRIRRDAEADLFEKGLQSLPGV